MTAELMRPAMGKEILDIFNKRNLDIQEIFVTNILEFLSIYLWCLFIYLISTTELLHCFVDFNLRNLSKVRLDVCGKADKRPGFPWVQDQCINHNIALSQ